MQVCPSRHDREGWERADALLCKLFQGDSRFREVRALAQRVKGLTSSLDPVIETFTSAVCPSCREVCCINRHSYHAFDDLIYIRALSLEPPSYKEGVVDSSPCQFLGERGCVFERSLRPFRCNWYFCAPLLSCMDKVPAKEYREFSRRFREVQEVRQEMLNLFFSLSRGLL